MIEILDLFLSLFFSNVNKFYIFPSVSGGAVFLLQMYQNKREVPLLFSDTVTIFTLTLSSEYLLHFLFLGSIPDALSFSDKAIIIIGIISTYILILNDCAEGTIIGKYTSKLLNRHSNRIAVIEPVPLFQKELVGLIESKKLLMSNKVEENNDAYNDFAHYGQAILSKIRVYNHKDGIGIEELQSKYNECKQKISDFLKYPTDDRRSEACFYLFEFIGKVEGISSSMSYYQVEKD